jgi:hypothetical protein
MGVGGRARSPTTAGLQEPQKKGLQAPGLSFSFKVTKLVKNALWSSFGQAAANPGLDAEYILIPIQPTLWLRKRSLLEIA